MMKPKFKTYFFTMKLTIKTTAVLVFLMSALSFTACNKEVELPETTNESIAGIYKVTAMTMETPAGSRNLFETLDDCQKQSRQILEANSSYRLISECDASENETGSWGVNGKTITINGVPGELISFNGRDLVIAFDQFLGMRGRMTETLTRQ